MHKIDLPDYIVERAKLLRGTRDRLFDITDPARTAHVVVDLQNGFMRDGAPVEVPLARDIVPNVNRISAELRAAGGLVVFLRYTYDPAEPFSWSTWYKEMLTSDAAEGQMEAFVAGAPDHSLWDQLDIVDHDLIVDKTRFSGFVPGTSGLHDLLTNAGIDTLIITGTLTNCCCECTARDANQLNYRVIFVTDGNATHTDEDHNATLANMATLFADIQSTDQVLANISEAGRNIRAA